VEDPNKLSKALTRTVTVGAKNIVVSGRCLAVRRKSFGPEAVKERLISVRKGELVQGKEAVPSEGWGADQEKR